MGEEAQLNDTIYKGIFLLPKDQAAEKRWQAVITLNDTPLRAGRYDSSADAAEALDRWILSPVRRSRETSARIAEGKARADRVLYKLHAENRVELAADALQLGLDENERKRLDSLPLEDLARDIRQGPQKSVRQAEGTQSPKYIGVAKSPDKIRWQAQVGLKGTIQLLGTFETETEAAKAYDQAALKRDMDKAGVVDLNFKDDTELHHRAAEALLKAAGQCPEGDQPPK